MAVGATGQRLWFCVLITVLSVLALPLMVAALRATDRDGTECGST